MKKHIKNKSKWQLFGISGIFIAIPVFTQILINIDTIHKGSDDGWLGFWGGYLGAIIGVAGAIFVVQIQLNKDKENREAEKVDNTFFNLLSMHNEQKNILNNDRKFEKIYDNFNASLNIELLKEGLIYFYSKKCLVNDILEDLINAYEKFIKENEVNLSDEFLSRLQRVKRQDSFAGEYTPTDESKLYEHMCYLLSEIKSIRSFIDILTKEETTVTFKYLYKRLQEIIYAAKSFEWEVPDMANEFMNKLEEYNSNCLELLPKGRRKKGIENAINEHYSEIGAYFRIFHRIIKYINDKVIDEATKKDYLGFLRATINEKELLVIFYNAAYTERGSGLLLEIEKTTFFGESQELVEDKTVQHFDSSSLLWKSYDLKIMRDFGKK